MLRNKREATCSISRAQLEEIAKKFITASLPGKWHGNTFVLSANPSIDTISFVRYSIDAHTDIDLEMEEEDGRYYCLCTLYWEGKYNSFAERNMMDVSIDFSECNKFWDYRELAKSIKTLISRNCPDLMTAVQKAA